jgi:hypothetical protein
LRHLVREDDGLTVDAGAKKQPRHAVMLWLSGAVRRPTGAAASDWSDSGLRERGEGALLGPWRRSINSIAARNSTAAGDGAKHQVFDL